MARPKLLDDDMIESWCEAIATGLTPRLTCYRIGLDYSTSKKWIAKGESDSEAGEDTIEARFFARHTRARADRSGKWLEALTAGSTQDLRWLLEHCEPEEFGAKSKVEVTGKDGGAVKVDHGPDLSKLSKDDLRTLDALLAKAADEAAQP